MKNDHNAHNMKFAFMERGRGGDTPATQFETLISSTSWSANPGDYNSLIRLQFFFDGFGQLTFGYGQRMYAKIKCRFALLEANKMTLLYLDSPAYQAFKGFRPAPGCERRTLRYDLAQHPVEFEHPYEGLVRYRWALTVDESPFPEGLVLPLEVPRDYYGYRRD